MNKLLTFLLTFIFININSAFASPAFDKIENESVNWLEKTLQNQDIEKPYIHLEYNYEDLEVIPLRVSIKEKIKSEADLYEGQTVEFIVQKGIYEDDRIKIIIFLISHMPW